LKRRKLNSKNPKWEKKEEKKVRKKLIKEVKGAKIYALYYL
tara:strand:- start:29929 stop:30051 length:123 start_codon:yes stop_codon:yes gene_type:complete